VRVHRALRAERVAPARQMSDRRRLLRWANRFALVNAAVLAVVGLRYLWYYFALTPSPAWVYAIVAFMGHSWCSSP
jgi:membrane-anchored protein YejM (alkaline phosphatase superfamily)